MRHQESNALKTKPMTRIAGGMLWLLGLGALSGCGDPATSVVKSYMNQAKCTGRTQFILEPDTYQDVLKSFYADETNCIAKDGPIDASECREISVGQYCEVKADRLRHKLCLKRVDQRQFKIDWPCSTGWNPKPLKIVSVDQPRVPVIVRVRAELRDIYTSGLKRENVLSIFLKDSSHFDYFYMDHKRRTSASKPLRVRQNAENLRALLSDGREHEVTVAVAYVNREESDEPIPFVTWFVQDGWRTLSESEIETAKELHQKELFDWMTATD